jgi:peptidoglycan/xylan/chitin deacetylase (PgdA/CDA1 family)
MFYPSLLWRMPKTAEKTLYLTFDDGPHPLITPLVLEILKRYNAKATFFCIGNNVQKYPDTFKQVKNAGHSVGCHTFNHEDGFKTKTDEYVESVLTANKLIHSNLFRPPHGRIRRSEIKKLQASNSKLQTVAWTVIAYDWDHALTPEDVYKNVITNADDGAIIAFHDSVKAYNNMVFALPKVLDYYYKQGYSFKAL